jgi:hypothetical protein
MLVASPDKRVRPKVRIASYRFGVVSDCLAAIN